MRILLVTTEFPPQPGGIGHHACNLAKHLNVQGIETEVVCESRNEADFNVERNFDSLLPFPVHRIPRKRSAIPRFTQRFLRALRSSQNPKIILMASGLWPLLLIGSLNLLRIRKQPAVYIAHAMDINPSNRILKAICHFLLFRFDRIIAVSAYTKAKLPPYLREKTTVIPNGFDTERFRRRILVNDQLKGNPSLITVGSVTARKGQINVVNALPSLIKSFPGTHYHLIGLPMEKDLIMKRAKEIGIQERIHFHGALEDEKMIGYLQQSDVFMMLSNHTPDGDFEGFGIAILEAASLGIPAIGSKGTGIEDAIQHGKSGLLVDPHQQEDIRKAVMEIMNNSSYFREQSKKHAQSFTWEKITPKYVEVLKDVQKVKNK